MMRRFGCPALLIGLLWWTGTVLAAPAGALLMGISEGVAEQASFSEMQEKYRPLANQLGRVLGRQVNIESSQNFETARKGLAKQRYDLMFVRPSNVTGVAIRDHSYQLVAMAKGQFAAHFIVPRDHGLNRPEDILTRRIAMPEQGSLMAKVGLAVLRDMGGVKDPNQIRYVRYQEAIPFMLEKRFADVGVVSPAQAKAWEAKGGVTLFKSRALPFWAIIASPKLSAGEVARLQEALIAQESSEEGKAILARLGVKGWTAGNAKDYVDLLSWIGE